MKIKNVSGLNLRIPRVGAIDSGETIDCPDKVAKYLITLKHFEKASAGKAKGGK